jgi:hypothetical protein
VISTGYEAIVSRVDCLQTLPGFCKDDLMQLAIPLRVPNQYTCIQGTTATGIEGLLVLLRRLSYPNMQAL